MIWLILAAALLLRLYRLGDLLGFYFDQGRDGLVIWNLLHHNQFFLIGPTTGVEGIFLGPFYYYLLAPAYWLGRGSPVVAAGFLVLINVVGIYWIYKIGKDFFSHKAGLIAAGLIACSITFIQAHRWLSNPTPLPLFAAWAVWSILKIIHGDNKWWWLLGLCMGLGLQLEAASAIFFIPAVAIIFFINFKNIKWSTKPLVLFFAAFGITLLPQLFFNLRHQNILVDSFLKFLVGEKSFQSVPTAFLADRLQFFWDSFAKLLIIDSGWTKVLMVTTLMVLVINFRKIVSRNLIAMAVWICTPMVLLLFYHGNHGYVWGYYFTGVYAVFVLMLAVIWSRNKLVLTLVVILFASQNLPRIKNYFSSNAYISLGTSLAAVDWVYQDANGQEFNQDAYVPPVIPYAYDYLFLWRGQTKYHSQPAASRQTLLYTLYEIDPPHPERLQAWMDRQKGIGIILKSEQFGGITSQRRQRI